MNGSSKLALLVGLAGLSTGCVATGDFFAMPGTSFTGYGIEGRCEGSQGSVDGFPRGRGTIIPTKDPHWVDRVTYPGQPERPYGSWTCGAGLTLYYGVLPREIKDDMYRVDPVVEK